MKTMDTIFKATLTISHAVLLCVVGAECIDTMRSRHKRKKEAKKQKPVDDEDEDYYSW